MNYYLLIYNHISEIVSAATPELAVVANMKGEMWHVRKGKAHRHFIAHEFYMNGRATGREIDIVDLGPTKDCKPPLPRVREFFAPAQGPEDGDVNPDCSGSSANANSPKAKIHHSYQHIDNPIHD